MKKRILLIEDEVEIANQILLELEKNTFKVDHFSLGLPVMDSQDVYSYDLVIMDIMLPDSNGFDIIHYIRESHSRIPILVISALTEVDYRVKGLDIGADDYLSKPFELSELVARVNALLRRFSSRFYEQLFFKDLSLESDSHVAYRGNTEIRLNKKEFELLALLLKRQGYVVSRREIIDVVWDTNYEKFNNTVDVHIRKLRCKIDDPFEEGYIKTVRGFGYVIK